MSHGVKIILERLRDFPADFVKAGPYDTVGQYHQVSWSDLATYITAQKETFTEEERKAVLDALRVARRLQFDAAVMDLLARPPGSIQELELGEQPRSIIGTSLVGSGVTYSGGVTSGFYK